MRPLVKWALLSVAAVSIGGPLGVYYKLSIAPPDRFWVVVLPSLDSEEPLPTVPLPLYPSGGEVVSNLTPEFRWRPSVGNGTVHYTLSVTIRSNATGVEIYRVYTNIPKETFVPKDPLPPGWAIRWRVEAIDSSLRSSGWGPLATFFVQARLPGTLSEVLPQTLMGSGSLERES